MSNSGILSVEKRSSSRPKAVCFHLLKQQILIAKERLSHAGLVSPEERALLR